MTQVGADIQSYGLRQRAVMAEQQRAATGADDSAEACAIWNGMLEGRLQLADGFESSGRRYYVVGESMRPPGAHAALDVRERQLVEILGSGQSEKVAAYALGVGPSVISALLKSALGKLGMRTRVDLVVLVRTVSAIRHGRPLPPPGVAAQGRAPGFISGIPAASNSSLKLNVPLTSSARFNVAARAVAGPRTQ